MVPQQVHPRQNLAIASDLLRYRDERGDDRADIIDFLTMDSEVRRKVVRLLGEIESADQR